MRWEGRERSENIEDRRSMRGQAAVGGGGLIVIIIGVIFAILNNQPPQQIMQQVQNQLQQGAAQGAGGQGADPELLARQAEAEAFSAVVLRIQKMFGMSFSLNSPANLIRSRSSSSTMET